MTPAHKLWQAAPYFLVTVPSPPHSWACAHQGEHSLRLSFLPREIGGSCSALRALGPQGSFMWQHQGPMPRLRVQGSAWPGTQ